jgi:uncharacterized protein (DUF111 family)
MRILSIDGQAGAAGDMILGALCHLGLDPAELISALKPIVPSDFSIDVETVPVCGIAARRLTVRVEEEVKHRTLSAVIALLGGCVDGACLCARRRHLSPFGCGGSGHSLLDDRAGAFP